MVLSNSRSRMVRGGSIARQHKRTRLRWPRAGRWTVLFSSLLLLVTQPAYPGAAEADRDKPNRIVVVGSTTSAPFELLDTAGNPRGVGVDIWRLWSEKTGIAVDYRLTTWPEAIAMVTDGRADVVGGIYQSDERRRVLDFSEPFLKSPTDIFFHKSISGLKGLEDLAGFKVGVIAQDYVEEYLKTRLSKEAIVVYDSMDEMAKAAVRGDIRVFVCDTPLGYFALAKHGGSMDFKTAKDPLYTNGLTCAVRKGNTALLDVVNHGFRQVSPQEIDAIVQDWTGTPVAGRVPWKWVIGALMAVSLVVGGVVLWNLELHRRVREATSVLRESEEKWHAILDSVSEAIFVLDADTGFIVDINEKAVSTYGIPREVALTRHAGEFLPSPNPDAREAADALIKKAADGEPQVFEWPRMMQAGAIEYSEVYLKRARVGGRDRVLASVRDITERKLAEEEIRQLSQFRESVIDNADVWIDVLDDKGRVLVWNKAAEKISGYSRESVIGKDDTLRHLYPDATYRHEVIAMWLTMAETGHVISDFETTIVSRGGDTIIMAWNSRSVRDGEGRLVGFVDIGRDVTQRHKLEEQLRHAQKMEAIGQLAGGIAHDFNNLLGGIMGYADLLGRALAKKGDDAKLISFAEVIKDTCQRAADLTAQLLVFSRRGKLSNEPVDMHDIIRKVVGLLEHTLDRRIEIQRKLDASASLVIGDPSQLQNAVLNLAVNARDAMPDGGTLTFATRTVTLDETYCKQQAYWVDPGEYIELCVADTGIGMKKAVMKRIFEPFFTTKGVGKGTGLGLAAVYGTVKAHKGLTRVYSETDWGTLFKLYLPVTTQLADIGVPASRSDVVGGQGLILVVDDEPAIRDVAWELLTGLGYEVIITENGVEAVEVFREQHKDIDLVILDMVMPKMNGLETQRRIRELDPDARILISSGFSHSAELQQTIEEGAMGLIQKPFLLEELSRRVAEALRVEPTVQDSV